MQRIALLFAVLAIGIQSAWAAPTAPDRAKPPGTGMTFRGDGVEVQTAPALRTDVQIDVSGVIARIRVRQTFRNPGDGWAEGVYVFPLPEKAAIDTLRMKVGDRIIEGEIREREQAQRVYNNAKHTGQRASLIEQERPNVFTASVANIAPKSEIAVEIGYQQRLRVADGLIGLRFPSVVGPRFIPGNRAVAGTGGTGWAVNTDLVPDAERITPPVRHPATGAANPLAITVNLDPGMPVAMLRSPSHRIDAADAGAGRFEITLEGGDNPANRDFVLEWRPDTGATPFAALFREVKDGETYLMAIVAPPTRKPADQPRIPRDVIFVIDTSGSMYGDSIGQARDALRFALQRLRPIDRFNIVRFASDATALYDSLRPARGNHRARAIRYVEGLESNGGTNIAAGLALALDGRIGGARLRQVVLITDGSVGNEAALFRHIRRDLGDSRLFTVGIGSAPNSHFMRRSAAFGRGTLTHIGNHGNVATVMSRLFEKLERPAMTQIAAAQDGAPLVDQWPIQLPDLYHGETVVFTARVPGAADTMTVSGNRGGAAWTRRFDIDAARPGAGIAKLWARDGIAAMMDGLALGADPAAVRQGVLELALRYGLLSKYTSLVSVDRTPARPADASLKRQAVPGELPAGWTYAKVFGGKSGTTATASFLIGGTTLFAGLLLLLVRRRRTA